MRAAAFTSGAAFAERDLTDDELAKLAGISAAVVGGYVDRFAGAIPLDGNGAAPVRDTSQRQHRQLPEWSRRLPRNSSKKPAAHSQSG